MSMQTTSDNASGEPMLDVNVTPLIDVMLVLLIMFIITIPIQTHAVKLDLPVNQPQPDAAADRPGQEQVRCRSTRRTRCCGTATPVDDAAASFSSPGAVPVSRYDAADEPDSGASPAARRDRALRESSTRCSR
jgi:cell division protein FtsN